MRFLRDDQLHRSAGGFSQGGTVESLHGNRVFASEASSDIGRDDADIDIGHGNLHDHFLDVGALEAAFHIALVWSVPPGNETGTFSRKRIGYGLIL